MCTWVLIWFGAILSVNAAPILRVSGTYLWNVGVAAQIYLGIYWVIRILWQRAQEKQEQA